MAPSTIPPTVRILSHMNKDHKLAIEDYLIVYGNISSKTKITTVKLKEITLDYMVITFRIEKFDEDIEKLIHFENPVPTWSAMKGTLVDMAKKAAAKRGVSHIQIFEIVYPKLVHLPIIYIMSLLAVGVFQPSYIDRFLINPLFILLSYLNVDFSNTRLALVTEYLYFHHTGVFLLAVLAHCIETYFFLVPLLNKYRTPTDAKLEWITMSLIEGAGCISRFKELIDQVENKGKIQIRDDDKLT